MRKILLFVAALLLTGGSVQAQSVKELQKERRELAKASKAELSQKASKAARKEAKKLAKEGWGTTPGHSHWISSWINRT